MPAPHRPLPRVLVVDDEAPLMEAICDTLNDQGYDARGFSSAREALSCLHESPFDVLLTDLSMPEMDGVTLLKSALGIDPDLVGIIMTGQGTVQTAVEAMRTGAHDYILKPFKLNTLLPVIDRATEVHRLRSENIQLRAALGIYELSASAAFTLDAEHLLDELVDAAMRQCEPADAGILLTDEDGRELRLARVHGTGYRPPLGAVFPLDCRVTDWVERSGRIFTSAALDSLPLIIAEHPFVDEFGGIALPMVAQARLTGVLLFRRGDGRIATLGQIKALEVLAGIGASALSAARLHERVKEAEERYRQLADGARDVIFRRELVPENRVTYINRAVEAVIGYSPEDFYADPWLLTRIVHAEDLPVLRALWEGRLDPVDMITLRMIRRDGSLVYVEVRFSPLRDGAGRFIALEGIARDVTDKKLAELALEELNAELETRVRERTATLEVANREMEAFSHSVSHDLRAPLRAIDGFARILLDEYAAMLPAEGRRHLDAVCRGAKRMSALIDDLLALGQVGRQSLDLRPVGLDRLVEEINDELRPSIADRRVELRVGALPECHCDSSLLRQVLINLIGNALKFTRGRDPAVIEIGAEERDGETMVFVRDNGAGFDMRHAERLFGAFQRLHRQSEFEGTGIGLSIVARIIARHGGRVWAEGRKGEGATFFFTLPASGIP